MGHGTQDKLMKLFACLLSLYVFFKESHADTADVNFLSCHSEQNAHWGLLVCDCDNDRKMYEVRSIDSGFNNVAFINCDSLRVRNGTFAKMSHVSKVSFLNIGKLELEQFALDFSGTNPSAKLGITFRKCNIEEMPSGLFSGNIERIEILSSLVGSLASFSISGIQDELRELKIIDSNIGNINRLAIKKVKIMDFLWHNSALFSPLPSQSIYDVTITNRLSIVNATFDTILPGAIWSSRASNLEIRNSTFRNIGGQSFFLSVRRSIELTNNTFSQLDMLAFRGITLDHDPRETILTEKPKFIFENNRVNLTSRARFVEFPEQFRVALSSITLKEEVDSFTCDRLYELINDETVSRNANEIFISQDDGSLRSVQEILDTECSSDHVLLYVLIGVFALSTIIVAAIIIFILVRRKRKRQLNVIMPDPRTYYETQIVMQVESVNMLKTDL